MVVVHVNHVGRRRGRLRYLMHVARGRQAGPDVEELPDTRLGRQVPDRASEERAVLAGRDADGGVGRQDLVRRFAVGGEVILPA